MRIKNALIFTEEHTFEPGDIIMKDGVFAETSEATAEEEIVDAEGCFAIPGLVDIHFHGCDGADMCDATEEALDKITAYEASVGVTSICPATMTIPVEELHRVMKTAGDYAKNPDKCHGAKLVGINMEGPFISKEKKGAQSEESIIPCDSELFYEFQQEAGGLIKLVDIAPEEAGAMEFIDEVKGTVTISIAHTTADYDTATEALERGASHITHLYNAMPPYTHRKPGVIGAACDAEHCHVELICDGIHIHPSVVRNTFKMFGPERVIIISDSMRATGLGNGWSSLGGQDVFVDGKLATFRDGTIAGSATNLMGCVKTAVLEMGIPMEAAIASATENPAKEIGIFDRCGSIRPGKDADLVLMNEKFEIKAVFINGKKIEL